VGTLDTWIENQVNYTAKLSINCLQFWVSYCKLILQETTHTHAHINAASWLFLGFIKHTTTTYCFHAPSFDIPLGGGHDNGGGDNSDEAELRYSNVPTGSSSW
jgi:hypothetical protein